MTESRKPSLILSVAITLAVLLGLYFWAYFGLVMPEKNPDTPWYRVAPYPTDDWKYQGAATRFFAPMYWLDRRIRPHVWEPAP